MDKLAFADIGELGWSLYLSAHIRWLKRNTDASIAIFVYSDRQCLYQALADSILKVPQAFYDEFNGKEQCCFGLLMVSPDKLREFFLPYLPEGYRIPNDFVFTCKQLFGEKTIYEPYPYSKKMEGKKEILIFPRFRKEEKLTKRNLPKKFYRDLIIRLCDEFPELTIRTIGSKDGAYDIQLDKSNYVNWVGKGKSLQDLIDRCQVAMVAIGGQSAPPKLMLLQGIPTYIIGHQKKRHVTDENWMRTKVSFWQIEDGEYEHFDGKECVEDIVRFVKDNKND